MRELKVIRSESDKLIVATESGETFSLAVDDALRAEVRRARTDSGPKDAARPSPREIQAHVRAGLSADEVAALLQIGVEDVVRFEAPVLAEREHIVGLALAVPVLLAGVDDADQRPSFGDAIRAKLADAGAAEERWSSWKDDDGWSVKLAFRVGEVEHDARWSFDPRRATLSPANADATQLSRQGALPEGLIPRLRALDTPTGVLRDDARFDSGAFGPRGGDAAGTSTSFEAPAPSAEQPSPQISREPDQGQRVSASDAAVKRAPDASTPSSETADLLEALRRRRGQREPAPGLEAAANPDGSQPVALFDVEETAPSSSPAERLRADGRRDASAEARAQDDAGDAGRNDTDASSRRRGSRSALPTWDEIVFGARSDND